MNLYVSPQRLFTQPHAFNENLLSEFPIAHLPRKNNGRIVSTRDDFARSAHIFIRQKLARPRWASDRTRLKICIHPGCSRLRRAGISNRAEDESARRAT